MKTNKYGLVPVKFIKGIEIYTPGSVAGFVPKIAGDLIAKGYATLEPIQDEETTENASTTSHSESASILSSLRSEASYTTKVDAVAPTAGAETETNADNGEGSPVIDGSITLMGIDDEVTIPQGWEDEHHATLKKWARELNGETHATTEAAKATITAAIKARAAAS